MLKVIWPRCEADQWPQSSAEAKNACSCICITSHIFMTLSSYMDNFTFTRFCLRLSYVVTKKKLQWIHLADVGVFCL